MTIKPRTLCKQLPNRKVSLFYSKKSELANYIESRHEMAMALCLEFNDNVDFYQAQPAHIEFLFKGKMRRYTPDFFVRLKNGRMLVIEVKCASILKKDAILRERLELLHNVYEARGIEFRVVTDEQLHIGVLIPNLFSLLRYRNKYLDIAGLEQILSGLSTHASATRGSLRRHAHSLNLSIDLIDIAIAKGVLGADLTQPLNDDLIIHFNHLQ